MGQFEGKTAVITGGGTRGIGRATARRLAAEGAHVFITGRRKTELDEAVEALGASVTAVPGDITDPADLDRLYAAVQQRGRGLDILFANAGTASFATVDQLTTEELDRIFNVNVTGTFLTVQKALPVLNDGASVILNASTAADRGAPAFGAYAASKAAIRSFARTWANELKGRGIRVNAISPGTIDTSGVEELNVSAGQDHETVMAALAAMVPIGRQGLPDEVAATVAFLASPDSRYIVGSNLYIDGGVNQI
jgi:NAD(P)-dependent dehydrogenase (short-subunit alcohol dehydrogenase family)